MRKVFATLTLLFMTTSAFADLTDELSVLEGFTIVGSKRIVGWYDKNGERKGDSFEGCDYDRVIVFNDNKILICRGYKYHYGYRPQAIILSNGFNFKMVVGDDVYNMSR
jgi:hypothetical protein